MESNPYQSPNAPKQIQPRIEGIVPYESGHGRAVVAVILLSVCVAAAAFSAISDVMQIGLIERIIAGDPTAADEAGANDAREMLIGVVQLVGNIATAVCFLVWVHRVQRNLPALGAEGLEFTPGWAVGWWFVPIANLWKPFQVVQEIWRGSDPNRDMPNVSDWGHHSSSEIIGWWWTAWIARNIAAQLLNRVHIRAETPQEVIVSSYGMLVSNGLDIVAAILAIAVVLSIDRRQEQRFEKMAGQKAESFDG